jgi:hypothetical protein
MPCFPRRRRKRSPSCQALFRPYARLGAGSRPVNGRGMLGTAGYRVAGIAGDPHAVSGKRPTPLRWPERPPPTNVPRRPRPNSSSLACARDGEMRLTRKAKLRNTFGPHDTTADSARHATGTR